MHKRQYVVKYNSDKWEMKYINYSPMIPNVYEASGSTFGGVSNQKFRAESPFPIS